MAITKNDVVHVRSRSGRTTSHPVTDPKRGVRDFLTDSGIELGPKSRVLSTDGTPARGTIDEALRPGTTLTVTDPLPLG